MSDTIDTGDTVLHAPTGEEWLVAYVIGDRISWCGWPEGEARLSDCTLVRKATDEERMGVLRLLSSSSGNGDRQRFARAALEQKP